MKRFPPEEAAYLCCAYIQLFNDCKRHEFCGLESFNEERKRLMAHACVFAEIQAVESRMRHKRLGFTWV